MVENKYKPVTVVDASVILKWILKDEVDAKKAEKIGDQCVNGEIHIFVPEHTYTEVANILALKGSTDISIQLHRIFDSGLLVTAWHTVEVTNKATEIMKEFKGISFYDAVYHALAIVHDGTFITADEKYQRLTKKLGHSTLLKDYA